MKNKKEAKYPSWKREAPKDDEPTSKEVDGKTFHWCTKCRNNEDLWALHKAVDHNDNYVRPSLRDQKSSKASIKLNDVSKKVSFSSTKKQSDGNKKGPAIKASKNLLNSTKSYLAQFSDFREAGA